MFADVVLMLSNPALDNLRTTATLCAGGVQGDEDDSDRGSDAGSEEQGVKHVPCEVCGRLYPHEHVKALYRGGQQGREGNSEGDDSGGDG